MLRGWLDSWSGVGHILDAMTAAGHHVELRQSVFGWHRAYSAFSHGIGRLKAPRRVGYHAPRLCDVQTRLAVTLVGIA